MPGDDDVSTGELNRKLDALAIDVRGIRDGSVSTKTFEDWRRETYAPRVSTIESNVTKLEVGQESIKAESERRYRTSVNLALGAFLSFLGGAGLLILQLVAK